MTRDTSHVTRHTSNVTRHTFYSIGDDGSYAMLGSIMSHSKLKVLGMQACSLTDVAAVLLAYTVR